MENFLELYRRAYEDKQNRGLFKKWEMCKAYWEGEVNLPQDENDPGSNINIIHPTVEGQIAFMVDQNVSVQVLPITPSEQPFAKSVEIILEWIKRKNNLICKIDQHERRREIFGTGIFRVTFDPDKSNGLGMPVIECPNPANVFVDPAITDVYKIEEASYIIETMVKSVSWANEVFGEKAAEIKPGYDPTVSDTVNDGESYTHLLVWTKKDGILRLVEMSGCGVVLYDSFDEKNPESFYPNNKYPYFFTPLYYREGSIWGKSDIEMLMSLQDLINDIDDQIRINARLTGNPQRIASASANIDIDDWTNEPGLILPVADINGLRYLQSPSIPSYIIQRRNMALEYERQLISRFGDQMIGQGSRSISTATEAAAVVQSGNIAIDHKRKMLIETLNSVFSYCVDLIKEFYTEQNTYRIPDKADEFIHFRGSELKSIPLLIPSREGYIEDTYATKEADFEIIVMVGSDLPHNKAFMFNVMRESFHAKAISLDEYRKWLQINIGLPIDLSEGGERYEPVDNGMSLQ